MRRTLGLMVIMSTVAVIARAVPVVVTDWSSHGQHGWLGYNNGADYNRIDDFPHVTVYFPDPNFLSAPNGAGWTFNSPNASAAIDTGSGFIYGGYIATGHSDFAGNYVTGDGVGDQGQVTRITFDFYSDPGGGQTWPGLLSVFFVHDANGANQVAWFHDIDVTGISSGWNVISVDTLGGSWYRVGPSAVSLVDALRDVDLIGIHIAYQPNQSGQTYGLDDFTLENAAAQSQGTVFRFR
jgi:hypothetical protein